MIGDTVLAIGRDITVLASAVSRSRFRLLVYTVSLAALCSMQAQGAVVAEASGVARLGDSLLIVDDGQPGGYYRFPLRGEIGPVFRVGGNRIEWVSLPQAHGATDLEAIDVLGDTRVCVLSERLHTLFGAEGVVAEYDVSLGEFGKRGLEGLAIRRLDDSSARIAVLWEGGYPEVDHLPPESSLGLVPEALRPLIQVRDLHLDEMRAEIDGAGLVELDVPIPPGSERPESRRFRAPDLVWYRCRDGAWGFIVLLSSTASDGKGPYADHWLQRFSEQGKRVGEPIDLDRMLPDALKGANWEGLAWFEKGQSLVMVHENDENDPESDNTAYVLQLPRHWRFRRPTLQRLTEWMRRATDLSWVLANRREWSCR